MALAHLAIDVPYDVTANISMDDTTVAITPLWNESELSTATMVLQPMADPNMPMVRFICEVAVSLPLAIFGIIGNISAFVVLCQQKQRLTTNVLLQALAIADTLVLVSTILLRSLRYVEWEEYNNIYHYIFVTLYPCVYFFRLADTWLTVMMTIDRYIAVCHPLQAQRLCTLSRTYISMAVILLATLVFSVPRFFEFELSDKKYFVTGFVHTQLVRSSMYTIAYRITMFFLVMYLIPMSLLIVLNIRLLCTLRRAQKQRISMTSRSSSHSGSQGGTNSSRGVTIIVATIVIVCILCNVLAITTHVVWAISVCFRSMRHLEFTRRFLANISNVFVTFNSAINFIIYCMFSRKFRLGLKQACGCESLRSCTRRWGAEKQSDSSGTPHTSYTSMMRLPDRVSFRNHHKLSVQKKASTEM